MTHAQVIDGKALAEVLIADLAQEAKKFGAQSPGLATILVGEDPASQIYIKNKIKAAAKAKIQSFHSSLPNNTDEKTLLSLISKLNDNPKVHGILVQLPLPKAFNEQKILESIDPKKDVDGFHPINLGYLLAGSPGTVACTPLGVMHMLKSCNINLSGKHAVVVGRSTIVGKPMAHLLLQENATVTICHSKTKDLAAITKLADILVVATGKAHLINESHVKPGAVVIDVGMNRNDNNKLVGDVDFDSVEKIASFISPVPGGVGPLTIAILLKNTWTNFLKDHR